MNQKERGGMMAKAMMQRCGSNDEGDEGVSVEMVRESVTKNVNE